MIFDSFVALLRKNWSNIVLYPENRLFNLGITIYWMIGGREGILLCVIILCSLSALTFCRTQRGEPAGRGLRQWPAFA